MVEEIRLATQPAGRPISLFQMPRYVVTRLRKNSNGWIIDWEARFQPEYDQVCCYGRCHSIPGEIIMMLKMSQGLGRQIRTDDAPALGDATYRLLIAAIQ